MGSIVKTEMVIRENDTVQFFLSAMKYLIGITIVLNIATASPAFVVIEVQVCEGDTGEFPSAGIEPAST